MYADWHAYYLQYIVGLSFSPGIIRALPPYQLVNVGLCDYKKRKKKQGVHLRYPANRPCPFLNRTTTPNHKVYNLNDAFAARTPDRWHTSIINFCDLISRYTHYTRITQHTCQKYTVVALAIIPTLSNATNFLTDSLPATTTALVHFHTTAY